MALETELVSNDMLVSVPWFRFTEASFAKVPDNIPAEVERLEQLGAVVVERLERWVIMQAPSGQRFCVVRIQRPGFPKNANRWD